MYCSRAASMTRSLKSGCENATSNPDWRLGSNVVMGLLVVVRAVSHDRLQEPDPQGRRCRNPVDENRSLTLIPWSPSRRFDGGVALLERPNVVENIGTNAARL